MANERTPKPGKTRYRRTPDEQIADLHKEIERIERRAATKDATRSPDVKHAVAAVRSIDRALEKTSDKALTQAIGEAREMIVDHLKLEGVPMPKKRGPRKMRIVE